MRQINKYFIYNDMRRILFFHQSVDERENLFLPKIVADGLDVYETNSYFQKIMDMLDKESLVFLKQKIKSTKFTDSINGKLIKVDEKIIRNFYSCYKNFNSEELAQIVAGAREHHLIPEMITFNQYKRMVNKPKFACNFPIDAIEELEQKLYYKKY